MTQESDQPPPERQWLLAAIQDVVRQKRHGFTLHATSRATEEDILLDEVEVAICSSEAEIIEDHPNDRRGPSCLSLSWTSEAEPLHIVCSYPPDVAIITVYRPDSGRWIEFRTRRQR